MPVFSRFGVWDKEVKQFIKDLGQYDFFKESMELITEWFYSEGYAEFIKCQGAVNDIFIKQEIGKTGLRPAVSDLHMFAQKIEAFEALWLKFSSKFLLSSLDDKNLTQINNLFKIFVHDATQGHKKICVIQADVMNQYSHKLNKQELNPKDTFDFLINCFNEAKEKYPDASEDIENHIETLKEYFSYSQAVNASKKSPLLNLSTFKERTSEQLQILNFSAASSLPPPK